MFVDLFLEAHKPPPKEIILDLDATDDPLHGHQEGRFFHGYYDCYCYLPLYVFCGRHLLAAKLRRSNIDASAGAVAEVARIVGQIRARWPRVEILLRADSGFARDELMAWCEANGVDYVFGLARNQRLVGTSSKPIWPPPRPEPAESGHRRAASPTSPGARWTAGAGSAASSPRPSTCPRGQPALRRDLAAGAAIDARTLYEDVYCARGEIENRIKEQQLDLFADRTSAATMRANQLRLWFASFAYVLLEALRRIGLRHTQFANATCGTIRLKLLKIGAQVTAVRRIKVAMASACPYQTEFALAHLRLPLPDSAPPSGGLTDIAASTRSLPAALRRARTRSIQISPPTRRLLDVLTHPGQLTRIRSRPRHNVPQPPAYPLVESRKGAVTA